MNDSIPAPPQRLPGLLAKIQDGLRWRIRRFSQQVGKHLGVRNVQWARVEMDRATSAFIDSLKKNELRALEISGHAWKDAGFREYQSASFPEYDMCAGPLEVGAFDVVILEQVLEHVLWPFRAVRHVYEMLRPGGWFVVSTPFLLRIHRHPTDCCRWTEMGLKHLLAEAGFDLNNIQTGSWGNRACVKSNLNSWPAWIPWLHSLKNEVDFPVVVWAFGQRSEKF
jgi:SAM-dependent methyltransferase